MTFAASMMLALAMLIAPDMRAQTRRSSGGSTTQQSSSSRSSGSSSNSRSSSSSSGSSSSVRSSGSTSTRSSGSSAVQQDNRRNSSAGTSSTRSSGSSTRSSGSSSSSRSSGSSSVSRSSGSSSSATRSSGVSSSSQQDNNRRNGSATRSSGTSTSSSRSSGASSSARSSSTTRSSGSSSGIASTRSTNGNAGVRASSSTQSLDQRSSGATRSSNVTRGGLSGTPVEDPHRESKEAYRDAGYNYRYNDDVRVDDRHNMYRVPPRQRDPMAWDRPGHFWGDHPHYYGYRISTPPPTWRRISHWGIDYYYYNGIYYRPFGGSYVICRPPFGTPLENAIDRAILRAIRFAYYYDTYRTYESVFDYYNVIARQNLIIAQQNARIIARNSNYAINSNRALSAYELANKLGLVQSYAYANAEYFYQDGVFYTVSASGVYSTIVPPAGALVTSLPDDYEIIVMDGIEYYLVDNTVFRTTVFEGEPYLEVLGQMYGSLYNQYNIYR